MIRKIRCDTAMNFKLLNARKEYHMNEYLENQLNKSVVYQQLKDNCERNNQHEVLALVAKVGTFAVERLKTVIKNMPEFTLHDDTHIFNMLTIIGKLIPQENMRKLSTPDLFMLIVSVFLHDIGMAPDEKHILAWKNQLPETEYDEKLKEEREKFARFRLTYTHQLADIERFECDEALHISIEGYESLFVISDSNKKEPGTDTILTLRPVHPWDRMNEEEFMQCIKGIVPNPAVQIEIETNKGSELYSSDYFDDLDLKPLLDYSWNNIKNIRKIDIDLTCEAYGFKGKGCIGILIKNGLPAEEIEILSKDVEIDGEIYTLSSNIKYKTNCITETSTSISVDEDGEIDTNTSWSERFKSKASLSIHGIEVPYNLFPDYSNGMSKAALKIPFPFSFRLDIGVNSDLNLNSARDQIIYDEKWLTFEENLYRIICRRLKDTLSSSDWKILNEIIQKNNTDTFSRVANSFE